MLAWVFLGAAAVAAAVQPSATPPPAPPGVRPGTEWFDRARASYEEGLRRDCMSEPGIAIAVAEWVRFMSSTDRARQQQAATQELGEASLTHPIDLERLERALHANAEIQSSFQRDLIRSSMRVMRELDVADRAIFGRRLTTLQPAHPPMVCSAARP